MRGYYVEVWGGDRYTAESWFPTEEEAGKRQAFLITFGGYQVRIVKV